MGRMAIPRNQPSAEKDSMPMGAYAAGFLAFLSTIYVLLNRQPLPAVLTIAALWTLGLLLMSKLNRGRWKIVIEYFRELRSYQRKIAFGVEALQSNSPAGDEVELSESEREQFVKLMNGAGFNWPSS